MDELVHHCLRELAFDGDLGVLGLRYFLGGCGSNPALARHICCLRLANLQPFLS